MAVKRGGERARLKAEGRKVRLQGSKLVQTYYPAVCISFMLCRVKEKTVFRNRW